MDADSETIVLADGDVTNARILLSGQLLAPVVPRSPINPTQKLIGDMEFRESRLFHIRTEFSPDGKPRRPRKMDLAPKGNN